jgi:Tol biopolymer transport system component
MVTELLEGTSLAERIAQGPMPVRKALEVIVQVARGLDAAHRRGIVHRDLKPANVFLTPQAQVKILDFGVAKLQGPEPHGLRGDGAVVPTLPGIVLGTVGYMSPEQVRAETVDERSDQFSLGCVAYELLSGQPPFARPTAPQTLAAVLETDPSPLHDVAPRVPRPVAWVVERCLAKDPHDRYTATADLVRDLELTLGRLSEMSESQAFTGRGRSLRAALARWALPLAAVVAAIVLAAWWSRPDPPPSVPVIRYLTYSGRDSSPAASPDGKTIAFSSTRDGRRRIWLKQLGSGSEAPLTAGEDDHPRFSRDGSTILFTRTEDQQVSLYRVPSVGGEPRKLVDGALYGDFSPDGQQIAFVRKPADQEDAVLAVASADGTNERDLARLDATRFPGWPFARPRWSPDGSTLAATASTLQLGTPTAAILVDVKTGAMRRPASPGEFGVWRGGLAWAGPDQIVCAEPESLVGQQTGTSSGVGLLDLRSGRTRRLLWSPVAIVGLDVIGPGQLILEARSLRQSLREVPLRPSPGAAERWLTRGNSADRQPTYSPDGEWVVFSSNRNGNLDLWAVSRTSGAVRRLTDHPAHDSDPGFTPDNRLLWSSNRSGVFEVWIAESDGSGARQLTNDGVDAENPVSTPDGRFVVYASANPASHGLMRIARDGSGATLLVPGNVIEPEVSPDGSLLAFVANDGSNRPTLRVVRLEDGKAVWETPLPAWASNAGIDLGRCRWLPDSRSLAFILRERGRRFAVYAQDVVAGKDTLATRRTLASLEPDFEAESLGLSPDGASLTVSFREQLFDLMLADQVPGLENVRRNR